MAVTSAHMLQYLREDHMEWIKTYMSTRQTGYKSLLRLLQHFTFHEDHREINMDVLYNADETDINMANAERHSYRLTPPEEALIRLEDAIPWALHSTSDLMPPKTKANTHFQDVTHMVATDDNPVLKIWCAQHQIDLVVKQAAECVLAHREAGIARQRTLTAMLNLTIVDQGESDHEKHESFKSMRIPCYNDLIPDEQAVVTREIVKYTITVIRGLMSIQAERDDANKPLQTDAPPVLHCVWVRDVLAPHQMSRSTSSRRTTRHSVLKCYHDDEIRLQPFVRLLATCLVNTVAVESNISILKWEMDGNRTDMMYLSLEGVFQAK
ncbi:hypothetical protein H257_06813 [Aphanomyces astaci]|uniref:Uncharacterized protein n=1 Tax=Aphanomyces astaci TaxID=112090 RepID=W4GKZ4_APHAT|nr:hypothetical protein H257_06813 [Aphanomyces astaci]ETV79548.1 hypothetical protein H257_06813 [Aphanomyces astaci]|eukprot:XP_009830484.1 hypothetical protein H257_06813 [Aphanomyces astaci]